MKNGVYVLFTVFLLACGGSRTNSIYEKTIVGHLLKGNTNEIDLKVLELSEQGTVTVADSIAYLADEFKKDKQLIIDRIELAKKMSKDLQAREKNQSKMDEYDAKIAVMDARIDSLKNLTPDNLRGYDSQNSGDVLALIIRCKYSVVLPGGITVEETFDFFLSPDGRKCYGKRRVG